LVVVLKSLCGYEEQRRIETCIGMEGVLKMKIRVENKRFNDEGVYVGRGSVLGNKFRIGVDGNRKEVIGKYRMWLWGEIKRNNEVILNELWRLVEIGRKKELVLLCWCKPLPCHGDVVKSCLEWMDKNK
jgi:hypothetical protein